MDDPYGSSGSEAPPPYLGGTPPPGISERMQALMSRAEQEVAEQRQLQSLVADVRQSLQQIHDEVRQAAGAHTLETVRGEVTSLGSEIRSATTMLGERLEAVVRAVGAGAQVMTGVTQQLDRVTELLNHQQQQLSALAATVTQQHEALQNAGAVRDDVGTVRDDVSSVREDVSSVRDDVGTVRDDVSRVRGDVTALGSRVDGVADQVRSDTAAALNTLAERIDTAVLALAEALLRPRGGVVDEDAPTRATMTMPVTSPPPWAGAAAETQDETAGDDDDGEDEGDAGVVAEAPSDTDEDEEDGVGAVEAATEGVPAADATTAEEAPDATGAAVEDTSDDADETPVTDEPDEAEATDTADDTDDDADDDTADDAADEVPLSAWAADPAPDATPDDSASDDSAGAAFEAAFAGGDEPAGGWGWDNVREHEEPDDEQRGEKRRPWWRPGG